MLKPGFSLLSQVRLDSSCGYCIEEVVPQSTYGRREVSGKEELTPYHLTVRNKVAPELERLIYSIHLLIPA
jgi:hypothetical protein